MSKTDSAPPAMSPDSIAYLEEVKKGKPRKFAMICKGTNIVSLVVYKKGNVEKRKKEAKESGKGQFYFGIVDGRGQDIRFVLARADGFDSAPVKSTVLKSFLDEVANLKCKPYFEIVDVAPLALDEDDPLVARFLQLQGAALQACEAHSQRADEINELCLLIGKLLDQEPNDEASGKLDTLEALLASLGANASSVVEQNAAPQQPQGDPAAAFMARLKPLMPGIQQAKANPSVIGEQIAAAANEAGVFARQKDFEQAHRSLDEVERLLQQTADGRPKTDGSAVEFAKIKLEWNAAKQAVKKQLDELAKEILNDPEEEQEEESEEGDDMTTAVVKLDKVLSRLNEGLGDTLDELYSAEPSARPPIFIRLTSIVQNYQVYLSQDELIALVEENPYRSVQIRETLNVPLSKIQTQIPTEHQA